MPEKVAFPPITVSCRPPRRDPPRANDEPLMTPRHIRIVCVLACTISAVLFGIAIYRYQVQKSFATESRTTLASEIGTEEFSLSAASSHEVAKLLYIAGLLAALGGCFLLKADAEEREEREATKRLAPFQRKGADEEEAAED
jgi:hypothetical protein